MPNETGRPLRQTQNTERIIIDLTPEMAARLNTARGDKPRATFIRELIEKELDAREAKQDSE